MKPNRVIKDFAALAAGIVFPLSFAPFQYEFIAFISLAILFHVWLDVTPLRALGRGFLFGIGQFSAGVFWISVSLHDFAGTSELATWIITASCVIFLAFFPALAGFLGVWMSPQHLLLRLGIVFPGAWILLEWLRAWLQFPGFPWLQVGYSQLDGVLGGLAPVTGVYGIGLAVCISAGLSIVFIRFTSLVRWTGLTILVLIWLASAVLGRLIWTEPAGPEFKVTLLQGNIRQDIKWLPDNVRKTLRLYINMTRNHWDSRVIVWPETAVPVFHHQVELLLKDLADEAKPNHSDLLIGIPFYEKKSDRTYNALISIGDEKGIYLKRHLVPFGEYLPLKPLSVFIAGFMDFKMSNFSPGEFNQEILRAGGYPLAASVCYEDVFGQESLSAMPEALYLVNVTNDAWFGNTIALAQNLQMARMRARETGRYMVRAANTGLTAFISPDGQIIKSAPPFQQIALSGEIVPMAGATPYIMFGDYPIMIIIVTVLVVVNIRRIYIA